MGEYPTLRGLANAIKWRCAALMLATTLACQPRDASAPDATTLDASVPDASAIDAPPEPAQICTFYLDPVQGSDDNDGTIGAPWGSLESTLLRGVEFVAGDTLCLREGNHGAPRFVDLNYSEDLTVAALRGERPLVSGLSFNASSQLIVDGLLVDGSLNETPDVDDKEQFLVNGDAASHHITFRNVKVSSAPSISAWTKADWYLRSKSGIDMRGPYIRVERCEVLNTYHAVLLRGDHSSLSGCLIDNFAGDAIRGLGSFSTYEGNIIRDAYIDDYAIQHDDAFQAYNLAADPKIEGVTIRNNQILQFADAITPFVIANDLVSQLMQGIIITDGYADTWIVENNLVVLNHSHGISLFGARHCRVQNNTVVQSPHGTGTNVPWIRVADQTKTGQANFDNTIRNNISPMFTTWDLDASSLFENNTDIDEGVRSNYHLIFQDYELSDFRLRAASPAINAGVNTQVSESDLAGNPRVSGGVVDTGAFEFQLP